MDCIYPDLTPDKLTCIVCGRSTPNPRGAKPPKRTCIVPDEEAIKRGLVGLEFSAITATLEVPSKCGGLCEELARRMNQLGIEGCKARREELLAALRETYKLYDWTDKLRAGFNAVASGLALKLVGLNPLSAMFDLALERAEEKASQAELPSRV